MARLLLLLLLLLGWPVPNPALLLRLAGSQPKGLLSQIVIVLHGKKSLVVPRQHGVSNIHTNYCSYGNFEQFTH